MNNKQYKLTNKEKELIESRRRFIKVKRNSEKLTSFRKGSNQSGGERRISNFLKSELVEFHREFYFKGLYNYSKSSFLYFDFYLPKYNLCIEYDGQQHYKQKKTESAKINDFLKNAYCLKNNINFLRIKYTDFDNVEKLILEKIDKIDPVYKKYPYDH